MCYMIVSSKTVSSSNFQTLSKLVTSQFKINLVTLLIHHYRSLDILCFGFLCVRHVFRVYWDQTMKTNFQRDNKLSVYLDPHLENWSGCLFHTLSAPFRLKCANCHRTARAWRAHPLVFGPWLRLCLILIPTSIINEWVRPEITLIWKKQTKKPKNDSAP